MAKIDIRVDGVNETVSTLQKQHEDLGKKIAPIVMSNTKKIVKDYRNYVPVGPTGNLKKAVAQKLISKTRQQRGIISGTARTIFPRYSKKGYHRHLVAYGTSFRENKKGQNRGKMPANSKFASVVEKMDKLPFDREISALLEKEIII